MIALLSLLLVVATGAGLLIFPLGAPDRSSEITVTSFIATMTPSGGSQIILYDKGTGPANLTTVLHDGDAIDFSLEWENTSGAVFAPGDTLTIPILTAPDITYFPPASVPLSIGGTVVAQGVFSIVTSGGKDKLIFTITFNSAVTDKTVEGGNASGSCTIEGTEIKTPITWEDGSENFYGVEGNATFIKADAIDNNDNEGYVYFDTEAEAKAKSTHHVSYAYFRIYPTEADALAGTNFLRFSGGAIDGYTLDPAGDQYNLYPNSSTGQFSLHGLDPSEYYWIREQLAPSPYLPIDAPYRFTVSAELAPYWYVIYDKKNPADGPAPSVDTSGVTTYQPPQPPPPTPKQPPPIGKNITSTGTIGNSDPPVVGDAKHVFTALPDIGGGIFPIFPVACPLLRLATRLRGQPAKGADTELRHFRGHAQLQSALLQFLQLHKRFGHPNG